MTKIFELIRTSPGTGQKCPNHGNFQKMCIVMARMSLEEAEALPKIDPKKDISHHEAIGVSRYDFLYSEECRDLMNALKATDDSEEVYLFITELNRIGVESDKIAMFLDRAKKNHPKIVVISIAQYGFDLIKLADVVFEHHTETRERTGRSHKDAGGHLLVSQEDNQIQIQVNKGANELKAVWKRDGNQLPPSMILHGEDTITADSFKLVVGSMIRDAMTLLRKNEDINQYLTAFIRKYDWVQLNENVTHAIYLRRSVVTTTTKLINNLPEEQLASCVSYSATMLSQNDSFLTISEHANRVVIKRPGVIRMMTYILWGGIQHVIMSKTNRFSSDYIFWCLLDRLCDAKGVTIHISGSIGKDYMEIAKADSTRLMEKHERNRIKNTAIQKMRDELIGDVRNLSLSLWQLDSMLRQDHKMKKVNEESDDEDSSTGSSSSEIDDADADAELEVDVENDEDDRKVAHQDNHTSRVDSD